MRRAVLLALLSAVAVLGFATAALAVSNGGGQGVANAPGQAQAAAKCGIGAANVGTIDRQIAAGIQAGGGPKSVDVAPTNCDHFWQTFGFIGNTP